MSGHSGKHTPGYYREENETSYVDGNREHLLITSGGEATDARSGVHQISPIRT